MSSRILAIVAALVVLFILVDSADAQRRRRRRRPPAETTEQTETPTPPEGQAEGTPPVEDALPPGQQVASPEGAGVGSGDEAPAQEELPPPEEDPAAAEGEGFEDEPFGPDLQPIRDAFTTLMDELVQVRNRVATLGRQLFNTRVQVMVQNRSSDDNTLARIVLTLDGAPIFRADTSGFTGEDGRQVFDGFAAPGPHVLTIEVEQRARADDEYRYTMRDTFRFQVVRGKLTEVEIILDDDSDIAEDFADDGEGEYDVNTRVRVATRDIR